VKKHKTKVLKKNAEKNQTRMENEIGMKMWMSVNHIVDVHFWNADTVIMRRQKRNWNTYYRNTTEITSAKNIVPIHQYCITEPFGVVGRSSLHPNKKYKWDCYNYERRWFWLGEEGGRVTKAWRCAIKRFHVNKTQNYRTVTITPYKIEDV
jgi:hypothetical protein